MSAPTGLKIRDSTPGLRPAGKVVPKSHGTKECMVVPPAGRATPELVKRIRGVFRPEPGCTWDLSHCTTDPPIDPALKHGIKTVSSHKAVHLVNPHNKTNFKQAHVDMKEGLYFSHKTKPLGQTHDQSKHLPPEVDASNTTFGKLVKRGLTFGEVVTPQKSVQQIDQEFMEGRELYKKSHNDWDIGEQIDRDYDWSKYSKTGVYGVDTPHDNSGISVRNTFDWSKSTDNRKVIPKRLDNFREKSQPQLATVLDPIVDTMDVPPDHTFGIRVPTDGYGAGDLVQSEGPTTFAECASLDEGVLATVRSTLKKHKFNDFGCILEALRDNDKENSGVVPIDTVHDIVFRFRIPLTNDMLNMLIRWNIEEGVSEGVSKGVAYENFVAMINWKRSLDKDKLATIAVYQSDHAPSSDADSALSKVKTASNYKLSSQLCKSTTGDLSTHNYRTFGVPTIRSDLAAPRLKRVSDNKNYGGEEDTGVLLYPSIYSNHGVYSEDFFRPHPPEKIRAIFQAIGVEMSTEMFDDLWAMAAKRDPMGKGEVCVETFRMVAEEVKSQCMHHTATATAE